MSIYMSSTICPACRGELYADERSVADAKFRGYRGGIVRCFMGCTSIWLLEVLEPRPFVFTKYEHDLDERETRTIECERCHCQTPTRGSHTKRCPPCRDAMKLIRARAASRRHAEKKRHAAA